MSASPFRFLDVPAMVAEVPPPVPWLAPPVLPRAALTVLYAPGGDGKSLLSMALAGAVASGGELAGITSERGSAIYLDAENGEHEIHRRVHTLGLPSTGVQVADASRLDLRRHMAELEALVREESPDLLVLDSFRSLTPGMEENATDQTARALDPLRRLAHDSHASILLIHHANKGGREYRGASSIRDGVDVLWHFGRQEGDPDPQRRFLQNVKMRVAPDGDRLWLRLSLDRGRVLIDSAEPPEEGSAPVAKPVIARLSDAISSTVGYEPMSLTSIAEAVGRSPKDGSIRNALAALVGEGLLRRDARGYVKVQSATRPRGGAPLHQGGTPDIASPHSAEPNGHGLLTAEDVARELRVGRPWVYEHAESLGAIRLGDGPRPPLRFDLQTVRAAMRPSSGTRSRSPGARSDDPSSSVSVDRASQRPTPGAILSVRPRKTK